MHYYVFFACIIMSSLLILESSFKSSADKFKLVSGANATCMPGNSASLLVKNLVTSKAMMLSSAT